MKDAAHNSESTDGSSGGGGVGQYFLAAGLALAVGATAWLLTLPWGPDPCAPQSDLGQSEAYQRQLARNRGLEQEIERLQRALEGDPCQDMGNAAIPNPASPFPEGIGPENPAQGPDSRGLAPGRARDLADLLDHSVALVLVNFQSASDGERMQGVGSAFMVAPGLLVTNRHVVEERPSAGSVDSIVLVSKGFAEPKQARVKAMSQAGPTQRGDYALLEVDMAPADKARVLPLFLQPAKMDPVYAAGYPGSMVVQAAEEGGLIEHHSGPMITPGIISVVLGSSPPQIIHSARLRGGNSGGPLVDACGRVLGVNTYKAAIDASGEDATFNTLASSGVMAFLAEHNLRLTPATGRCQRNAAQPENQPDAEGGGAR